MFRFLIISNIYLFCGFSVLHAQESIDRSYNLQFEKVYVTIDRNIYAPGEDIWLKAYLLNPVNNQPALTSKNLYLELIAPNGSVVHSISLFLTNGTSKGDFHLPVNSSSGTYHIRCYTNWMKNFGSLFLYDKTVIVNNNKLPIKTIKHYLSKASAKVINSNIESNSSSRTNRVLNVKFYPEGGSLINGLTSIIGVRSEYSTTGLGAKLHGAIVSRPGNDTVGRFDCDSVGMGLFTLLPNVNLHYDAVYQFGNKEFVQPLPEALKFGEVLRVSALDTAIIISVSSTQINQTHLILSGRHAGKTLFEKILTVDGQHPKAVILPKNGLPVGVFCLTLSDTLTRPLCERLVFVNHIRNDIKTELSVINKANKKGDSIDVIISMGKQSDVALSAELSVSVTEQDALISDGDNIITQFLLQSELVGRVQNPKRYFDLNNPNRFKQLDLLLMIQGWREYIWRRLRDSAINISYMPEKGLPLRGKVMSFENNNPVVNAFISLYANLGVGTKLFSSKTDNIGRFYFDGLVQFGDAQIKLSALNLKGEVAGRIVLDSLSRENTSFKTNPEVMVNDLDLKAIARISERAEMKYKLFDSTTLLKEVKIQGRKDIVKFQDLVATTFGYKDEVLFVTVDDNQKETIKNFIIQKSNQARIENEAKVNKSDNGIVKFGTDVRLDRIVFYADGETSDPRLIVDGVEVPVQWGDEANKTALYDRYLNLPVSKLEKVVIKHLIAPPNMGEGATRTTRPLFVIYLTLKPGAMENGIKTQSVDVSGFYQARNFFKIFNAYPASAQELLNTIYWNPEVKITSKEPVSIKIPNPIKLASTILTIEGLSVEGIPIFYQNTFIK